MPTGWLRVTVTSPSDELQGLLAEGLLACGGSAVEEHGPMLTTYLAVPLEGGDDSRTAAAAHVRELLDGITGGTALPLAVDYVPEQDWLALWRTGLGPRRIGERIIVSPTWSDVDAAPHELVVRIDPQMAFGTGEHASTRGALRLLQHAIRSGDRVLDVGAGSGILAIAAARLGAAHVTAAESDEAALPNALENVDRNAVAERVTLTCALVDDAFLAACGDGAFDGIVANVLSGVLCPLLPACRRALGAGGWAILAGILVEEAVALRAAARAAGFSVEAEDTEEQWWSVLLRRRS